MKPVVSCAAVMLLSAASAHQYHYEDRGADHVPGVPPSSFTEGAPRRAAVDIHGRMLPPAADNGVNLYGLTLPTSVTWDPAGTNVYVAEKAGVIKRFFTWQGSGVGTANVVMDLSSRVTSWGDHGLTTILYSALGGEYLYATYMKRNPTYGNVCLDYGQMDGRPLDQVNGCNVYGVFSRFPVHADGTVSAAEEEVILDTQSGTLTDKDGNAVRNGCAQFSTHSVPVAVVELGGYFYTSLGDGAAFTLVDAGQLGANPCNDTPAYAGAFRSQDPTRLNGKVLRWTPAPEAGDFSFEVWTTGHRNPFRMSVDVENSRIYQTETGWYTAEEINLILPDESFKGTNMGWPCYEGLDFAPEFVDFFPRNPYCLTIPHDTTLYYTHPPDVGAGKPPVSVSAVAAVGGRLYYGDLSQGWVRSIPLEGVSGAVDLAGRADLYTVEATNVFPVQLVYTPRGMALVDHFPGAVTSLPGVIGLPVPSAAPPPPPPFTSLHTGDGNFWVAGQSITVSKQSNIEGREGAEWRWSAVLLSDCTPTDDCVATPLRNETTGGGFTFPAPVYPGTIEVRAAGRTYGGMNSSAVAFLVSDAAARECKCTGARVWSAAAPSFSPSAVPSILASTVNRPLIDTSSPGFTAGVAAAGTLLAAAILGVGVWAGLRSAGSKAGAHPVLSSRLANSTTGGTGSTERPMATNPAQRTPSNEVGESRADRAKRAGFAPTQAGGGAGAPAFTSPTASTTRGARAV